MRRFLILLPLLCLIPAFVEAQTNIRVLGTGRLAWDQGCQATCTAPAQTTVQGFTYRLYMPATSTTAVTLVVTCGAPTPPATLPLCSTPLSAFPLTPTAQSLALSAQAQAADGSQPEQRVTAPFVLSKTDLAASPQSQSMAVTP